MNWQEIDGLPGALISYLNPNEDARGSLTELMRTDQLPSNWPDCKERTVGGITIARFMPAMAYMSWTWEGEVRGPHEHKKQFDYFIFAGPGVFKLYLWNNTVPPGEHGHYGRFITLGDVGDPAFKDARPAAVIVPPGIVHGYKCVDGPGLVFNMPSELYKGWGMQEEVDEIRHENDPDSLFKIPFETEGKPVLDLPCYETMVLPKDPIALHPSPKADEKVKVVILTNGDEIELAVEIPASEVAGFKEGIHEGAGFFGGHARVMTLQDVEQELADGELREDLGAELRQALS